MGALNQHNYNWNTNFLHADNFKYHFLYLFSYVLEKKIAISREKGVVEKVVGFFKNQYLLLLHEESLYLLNIHAKLRRKDKRN